MDWALAIERNSEALKGIVAALFAMLGLAGEATAARIPQPLHRAVLRVLRPAESAVRRLIVIAARGLVVKAAPSRSMPMPARPIGKGGHSPPSFQLFDPRKNFAELRQHHRKFTRLHPRIHIFGNDPTVASLWAARRPIADPAPPPPRMASSTPNASPGGSRPSNWRLTICRARPGVSRAGGRDGRRRQVRSSSRRSGRAIRPATAGSRFTRLMKCSSNAMASPVMHLSPTRPEVLPTQPFASFFLHRKRHNRFHPQRSYARRSLTL
jgi:hypothetical protein